MKQLELLETASPSADSPAPCQNPGCTFLIVPAGVSDERCRQCGHAIVVEADTPLEAPRSLPAQAGAEPDADVAAKASAANPAGPGSIAARIVALCKMLGIQSDAEKAEQLSGL